MFSQIAPAVIRCHQCSRLRKYCQKIAVEKRRAFRDEEYWGKPVPGFGDPRARLVILGLAPAAHGANRTGRMFTGDRSGEWLYRALFKAGFANQAECSSISDGLKLSDCYITSVVKCAPPDNKPTPQEIKNCSHWLSQELEQLKHARVYLCLGSIALNGAWPFLNDGLKKPRFGHGVTCALPSGKTLLLSYHPSQQNTFTGRLTEPMFDRIFSQARKLI